MALAMRRGGAAGPPTAAAAAQQPAELEGGADGPPPLADVIEQMGLGFAQAKAVLLSSGVWFADGAELLLIGSVTESMSVEWSFAPWQRGSVVTAVFLGILLGNLGSGLVSDWLGRRVPMLISYVGIFVFSVSSACSVGYFSILFSRLLVGLSFGLGQPAQQTLVAEVSPDGWRIWMNAISQATFALGEMFSILLIWCDDPELQDLHWRWLLCVGAVPSAVYLVLGYFFLVESPRYLALIGKHEEAKEALQGMAAANGRPNMPVDFSVPKVVKRGTGQEAFSRQIGIVFSPEMLLTTCVVILTCFVLNFTFYGFLYAFPQMVGGMHTNASPAFELMTGAACEIVGLTAGIALSRWMGRKSIMKLYLVLQTVTLLVFILAGRHQQQPQAKTGDDGGLVALVFSLAYYCFKVTVMIGFLAVYQYATEVYPTEARASGASVGFAGGRAAGIVAPMAFEACRSLPGDGLMFFGIMCVLSAVNYGLVDAMPYETAGKALLEEVPKSPHSMRGREADSKH